MNKNNFRPEARAYALSVAIQSTDTLFSLLEQAYLAGVVRESLFDQPPTATFTGPTPVPASAFPYGEGTSYAATSTHALMDDGEPLLPVIHRNGDLPCHRIALYHRGRVDPNAKASLLKLRTYPGRAVPTPSDVPRCGSCGINIDPYSTQDLDWKEHLSNPVAVRPHLIPPEPGADSPPSSGESTGRTPVEDTASADVQPSAQWETLHQMATSMFDQRESREPHSWPANEIGPIRVRPLPVSTTPQEADDVSSVE